MCGIFGLIAKEENYNKNKLIGILEDVAKLSQVRGKDSSGIAYRFESKKSISVLKGPVSVDELFKTCKYRKLKETILSEKKNNKGIFAALGHARLVTNGSQLEDVNNQPVNKDGILGVHNGIVVNDDELWNKYPSIKKEYEIDTEVIYSIFRKHLSISNNTIAALKSTNEDLFGTISTGFFINDREEFIVYTNNGSLYILTDFESIFIYGSEKNILACLKNKHAKILTDKFILKQVPPNNGYLLEYQNYNIINFDLQKDNAYKVNDNKSDVFLIEIDNYHPKEKQLHAVIDPEMFTHSIHAENERNLLEFNIDIISKLKRCSKCLLPSTFPFIKFDDDGECNYCKNYKKKKRPNTLEELEKLVKPYRKKNGEPECIVPFSGGRDSTYTLHMLKKELGLNIITYTYDWGMVTDLARRNVARVCGKLGVENIIVSADIKKKRSYIKKNIIAWLHKPHLGMIPIFMAGDKSFHYYLKQLQMQTGLTLNIWGENYLENTDFKVGFSGVSPDFNKEVLYKLSSRNQIKLFTFLTSQYLKNPLYINESLFDNIKSHFSRTFMKKVDYYNFFDFYEWNEKKVEEIILSKYDWETAIDTKSTWRIGDGTASFYNYIYFTIAGFSEFDTFRSNQIREGMLTRDEGLRFINIENKPRYESLKWYLGILGLDFEHVIKKINSLPKLYI